MKKFIGYALCILMAFTTMPLKADEIDKLQEEDDALFREGVGADDGGVTALGTSMLGWGLGLGLVIFIVASVVHQSAD